MVSVNAHHFCHFCNFCILLHHFIGLHIIYVYYVYADFNI
uniref:Uncharacterized protein n=1 Tax=Vibrio parahaemolyticus TaxID=670 RepID=A0A1Y1B9U0_VIBPH|nr:hypothetical protein [Vibrio parahaemolyticus]